MGNRYQSTRGANHNRGIRDPAKIVGGQFVCPHKFIPAGVEIYAEGEFSDDLYLLIEGWAYQYQYLKDGRRQILDFSLPGTLLGVQGERSTEMAHTAESLTDAVVAVIPRWWLREILVFEPEFAIRVATATADALNQAYDNLTDVGRRNAYEAVAHLMLRLFRRIRAQCPGVTGKCVEFPLTQMHIGDALGLTNVHVCRMLKTLQCDGVLELNGRTLTVLDIRRLIEIAGGEPEFAAASRRAERIRSVA